MKRKITGAYLAILTVLVASTLTGCIHERPLSATNKIEALLQVIEQQYVDTVDIEAIVEQTLPKVLSDIKISYTPSGKSLTGTSSEKP